MKFLLPKKLLIFSMITSLSFSNAFANNEAAEYIQKDTKAPYDGILLPIEKAVELRKNIIELQTLKAINESYKRSIQMYGETIQLGDQKYNVLLKETNNLSSALSDARKSNDLQKMLWFGLGVLASGFAFYGAKKVTQ